jgi:hypothetical protein
MESTTRNISINPNYLKYHLIYSTISYFLVFLFTAFNTHWFYVFIGFLTNSLINGVLWSKLIKYQKISYSSKFDELNSQPSSDPSSEKFFDRSSAQKVAYDKQSVVKIVPLETISNSKYEEVNVPLV